MAIFSRLLPCCLSLWCFQVAAAPLDAFLSADTQMATGQGRVEAAYDAVNSTLDVFKIRAKDPVYGGTNVGDYSGGHLRGAYQFAHGVSVDGSYWQRKISYRSDNESLTSWQLGTQYRFYQGSFWQGSSYALRLSAWGDSASQLNKTTPTTVFGHTMNSISVHDPKDVQLEADLLGAWPLTDRTELSAFVGGGNSRVSVASVSGSYTTSAGCEFNLLFAGSTSTATLAAPCGNVLTGSFTTPDQTVIHEVSYHARYFQLGGMLQWHNLDWRLTGAYQFQSLNRDHVDAAISSQGGVAYKSNQILIGEVARKVGRNTAVFVRGQLMSHQFVGEIPFAYNSVTASKFASRYGLVSMGVMHAF